MISDGVPLYAHVSKSMESESHYKSIFLYDLMKMSDSKKNIENLLKDLTIISGSLAHELKNPIGGIIAGVELLNLMDGSSDNDYLLEIKKSATKSKELIDLFLGFSDVDSGLINISVSDVLEQTFKVLRFRTLTLDVKLSGLFKKESNHTLNGKNKSLLILSLYLLFNEIITLCSHVDLFYAEGKEGKRELNLSLRPCNSGLKFVFKDMEEHFDLRDIDNLNFISGMFYINSLRVNLLENGFEVTER